VKVPTSSFTQAVCLTSSETPQGVMIEGEFVGTCFSLGGNLFMTAGHVVKTLRSSSLRPAILFTDHATNRNLTVQIDDFEELNADLAILMLDADPRALQAYAYPLFWREDDLSVLEEVRSFGYGYGIQRTDEGIFTLQRAFRGYVVCVVNRYKPLGDSGKAFRSYELSFASPRGMSGAALLPTSGVPTVRGIVIGNGQSRMLVFDSEERTTTLAGTERTEYYEALTLGIAVRASEALDQDSHLCQGSVRTHLSTHGLLPLA
jgi:trypsin-like peptidase